MAQRQIPLCQHFADFACLGKRPELGLSVPMGREDLRPELRELHEGHRVLLIEWGNLCAEGGVRIVESVAYRDYSGVIDGPDAIRVIDPSATGAAAHGSEAS